VAPNLTNALTNDNLRRKIQDWCLWAYTDGSCLPYNMGTLRFGPEALTKLMHAVHKEIACM